MNRPYLFYVTLILFVATCSMAFFLVFKVYRQNFDFAKGEEYAQKYLNTINEKGSTSLPENISSTSVKNENVNKIHFTDSFDQEFVLEETGDLAASANPNWSVTSGAYFFSNKIGSTVIGDLPQSDQWLAKYRVSNPSDTDNGTHPQNIFRLVMLKKAYNFEQEVYFRIKKYNSSDSPERQASNGLFLFNRYQDSDDVYYTGIRVDGYSSIKKKINGQYHTMNYEDILKEKPYNRETNANLLPIGKWIGLKSRVENIGNDQVSIKLFMDMGRTGNWNLIAETLDDGVKYGGKIINEPGFGGIRTDFMDVEFDDYKMIEF
jgi:hypothetical protein